MSLTPSNGLLDYLIDAEARDERFELSDGSVIDTETGTISNGEGSSVPIRSTLLSAPTNGVSVRVFQVTTLRIGNTTVSGEAALAIVASDSIEVVGRLSIAAGVGTSGVEQCEYPEFEEVFLTEPGVGGAGFGGRGGDGGTDGQTTGLPGGQTAGNEALTPLRGGCSAQYECTYRSGDLGQCVCPVGGVIPVPGIGGGAIQISANRSIRIADSEGGGLILAAGAGAVSGCHGNAGLGGGSGGAILLEAGLITISDRGIVAANGGGGTCSNKVAGGGSPGGAENGAICDPPNGDGGSGGTAERPAQPGGPSSSTGGGGGGGVGRVRLNAGTIELKGKVSPSPSMGLPETR